MYSVGKIISGDFPAGKVPEKLNEARLIAISKVCSMYKGELEKPKVCSMYKGELEKQQKKKKQDNKTMDTSTPLVDNKTMDTSTPFVDNKTDTSTILVDSKTRDTSTPLVDNKTMDTSTPLIDNTESQ